jgi:hypothetical protein
MSKVQTKDFGMLISLVAVFLALYFKEYNYAKLAFAFILLTMVLPVVFYPFAFCWFGLSRILGNISSVILLTLIFIIIIVPIGFARKLAGYDSLRLKEFKKNKKSALTDRNHIYDSADLMNTF